MSVKAVYSNYLVTTNCGLLLSVPEGVTTETLPVVAPSGTLALMYVSDSTVNAAATPLNVTLVDPVRPLPRMMMFCPTLPATGTGCTEGPMPFNNWKIEPLLVT